MNTINCSCGKPDNCGCCGCCKSCQFNPCAVTCAPVCELGADYAYIYNTAAQTVASESEVTFSGNGLLSGTITHTAGTAEIVIGKTGVYLVNTFLASNAAAQFAVYRNGAAVEGSTYAMNNAADGNVIISAQMGDVLTVVNTGTAEMTLEAEGTAPEAVVNGAVTITRLF